VPNVSFGICILWRSKGWGGTIRSKPSFRYVCLNGSNILLINKLRTTIELHLLHVVMFLATGNIAMKLLEKKDSASLKAYVFAAVYHLIFWSSVPLQSIVDAHKIGYKGMSRKSELVDLTTDFPAFFK